LYDFNYQFLPLRQIISKEVLSLFALLFWLIVSWLALVHVSKTFKIIAA
jgi:hypothetical protein